ncbi:MAG: TIGR04282 family arsenosugar biosynthesis glycosyltransferase [Desulforhopalus sp.]
MLTNCRLLLFTRYPEAGNTKTRLIPELGATGAALLQKRLTESIVLQARLLEQNAGIKTTVHYTGGTREKMTSWLKSMTCVEQVAGDLGRRMRTAFEQTFANGAEKAVLIGSDIPDINTDILQKAFASLLSKEVVLGPSQDGGYYLIGLIADRAPQVLPLLFEKMRWSTGTLFATTANRLEQAECSVATLPVLRDIDLPTDISFARDRGML